MTPVGQNILTVGLQIIWVWDIVLLSQNLVSCSRKKKKGGLCVCVCVKCLKESVWTRKKGTKTEQERVRVKESKTEWVRKREKEEGRYIRLPIKLSMLLVLDVGPVVYCLAEVNPDCKKWWQYTNKTSQTEEAVCCCCCCVWRRTTNHQFTFL